jgi:hypothetical protein
MEGGLQEGGAIGDMYAYKQLSIYATDEEAAAGPARYDPPGADKTKHGGDVNWLDVDGNNKIEETDRIYMGILIPTGQVVLPIHSFTKASVLCPGLTSPWSYDL